MTRALINGSLATVPHIRDLALRPPAEGPVTQAFGVRSVTGVVHRGIDLGTPEGTPVLAVAAGRVLTTRTGSWPWHGPLPPDYRGVDTSNGGYGNSVVVDHGGFVDDVGAQWLVTSMYAHLSAVLVAPGQRLDAGATVGRSGSTGISTGDHLHWEVRRSADPFDGSEYFIPISREEEESKGMDFPLAIGQRSLAIPGSESGAPFRHHVTLPGLGFTSVEPGGRVRVVLQLRGGHPGSFAAIRDAAGNSVCFTTVQTAFAPSPDGAAEVQLDEKAGLFIAGQSLPLRRKRLELPPKALEAVLTVYAARPREA